MIHYELIKPKDLPFDWREVQALSRKSFGDALDRPQADIDTFIQWKDPEQYQRPSSGTSRSLDPNQSFSNPRMALARDGRDLIGFAYATDSVSGTSRTERLLKRVVPRYKHLWLREIVVHPDHQRRGIAASLGRALLFSGQAWQPVSTDIWPDESPFLPNTLRQLGFKPTDEQQVPVFGEDASPARQVRMQASSVYSVLTTLNSRSRR